MSGYHPPVSFKENKELSAALGDLQAFMNEQKAAFIDAIAGLSGSIQSVEWKTSRDFSISKTPEGVVTQVEAKKGQQAAIISIRCRQDFEEQNAPGGFNEQQLARSLVVFVFTYWDLEIRPRYAEALGMKEKNAVEVPGFGDLRLISNSIMHHRSGLSISDHGKLELLRNLFEPEEKILMDAEKIGKLFTIVWRSVLSFAIKKMNIQANSPILDIMFAGGGVLVMHEPLEGDPIF